MARILVVEDEPIISLTACMILEDGGHYVESAAHGLKALALLATSSPDLIITDFMMPRLDGLEMITKLRSDGWKRPIILSSAIPEAGLPDTYSRQHDAFLGKPYRAHDLLAAVDAALETP